MKLIKIHPKNQQHQKNQYVLCYGNIMHSSNATFIKQNIRACLDDGQLKILISFKTI